MKNQKLTALFIAALTFIVCTTKVDAQIVFTANFDNNTIPPEISPGTATITGVQGYAGLGPIGNQFGGNFLRSATANAVTLQLNNLPPHSAINLAFLFAAIDSLDGTGTFPEGDFFHVTVDGVTIFNESFANALAEQIQSYVPPPAVQLARRVDLGFSGPGGNYTDSAYNLGANPVFSNIPHSSSSLTLRFIIEGAGVQALDDESWAMDNLTVTLTNGQQPIPIQATIHQAAEVAWPTVAGALYQVQATPSLAPGTWTNFGTPITGDGTEKSIFDQTRNQQQRFYRVLRLK